MAKKTGDVLELIAKHGVSVVGLRYAGDDGAWRIASIPAERVDARALAEGFELRPGVTLLPDQESAHLDPLHATATLALICSRRDAAGDDPRQLVERAEARLQASGVADAATIGCRLRYSVFASAAFEDAPDACGVRLETAGAHRLDAVRADVLVTLAASGVEIEMQQPLAGARTALDLAARAPARAGDAILTAKHVVKTVAARHGLSATFMPQAVAGGEGNGLDVRLHLNKDGKSPFYDKAGWAGASQTLLFAAGGLLAHADSLLALCAPSLNSHTRLAAEPRFVAFGSSRAPTVVAIDPTPGGAARAPRLTVRLGDASANPYALFAALLCAALDGVAQRVDPISAGYGPFESAAGTGAAQASPRVLAAGLARALDALERDHGYLSEGGVFDEAALRRWSDSRRDQILAIAARPQPSEYALSYDC
jgi:glutamine synthetase